MESYHLQFLIKRFPEAKDKIFLLREFAEAGEGDIFDPFGGSIEGYETCLQEIKRCLPHVIRKIGYRRLVVLGSDHAGYDLKEEIKRFLDEMQFEYIDFGPVGVDSVDYPDFGIKVAEHVSLSKCWRGILICATGIGMSIVANKIPGIRAAICHNREVARLAREHNDANILIIGSKIVKWEDVREMVKIFLTTEASGGRHARRVNKIREIERKYLKGEE
jgi:ribose 5-phosphate isomerase B